MVIDSVTLLPRTLVSWPPAVIEPLAGLQQVYGMDAVFDTPEGVPEDVRPSPATFLQQKKGACGGKCSAKPQCNAMVSPGYYDTPPLLR